MWNPRNPDSQVFKAMTKEAIKKMQATFYNNYLKVQTDDYYYSSYLAKKSSMKQTFTAIKEKSIKAVFSYPGYEEPALGTVKLRHSSTSQPLVSNDSELNFCLPFEKNEMALEELWNYLLELEDKIRQEQPQAKINLLVRFIAHSLQFNTSDDAMDKVKPNVHQKFAFFLNDPKGQRFMTRFLNIMPQSFFKRFYFTSFIVFTDIKIDPQSQFAIAFAKGLMSFVNSGVKPKWIVSFIHHSVSSGFAFIAGNRFQSACLAILLTAADALIPKVDTEDVKMLKDSVSELADVMAKELGHAIRTNYDDVFMNAIFRHVLAIAPESKLQALIMATSV
ncbi:hypothetical protein GPJ56_002838 [Histomonas meleagridis]|uniref:uncharacterized protein n=1 Tax=Histomonas meleagridis TaxID=135588 RepID=UPI00355A4162|nr:hypothetical protein GPJ56_002838 [Histomonas meleagridis]KAH0806354.1 hypothetical protein GO595_001042 [Histomonas meleagridis]